jgi:hypothetical protein
MLANSAPTRTAVNRVTERMRRKLRIPWNDRPARPWEFLYISRPLLASACTSELDRPPDLMQEVLRMTARRRSRTTCTMVLAATMSGFFLRSRVLPSRCLISYHLENGHRCNAGPVGLYRPHASRAVRKPESLDGFEAKCVSCASR